MPTVRYGSSSPYHLTSIEAGELSFMVNRPIPRLVEDTVFKITPTYHLRPDLLAHDLYGDSRLWWVFAQRNPNVLVNPLMDFAQETNIFIPTIETLRSALGIR